MSLVALEPFPFFSKNESHEMFLIFDLAHKILSWADNVCLDPLRQT